MSKSFLNAFLGGKHQENNPVIISCGQPSFMAGVPLPGIPRIITKPVSDTGDDSPPLNPFNGDDDAIHYNLISIHDAHAPTQDVESLFNIVSKIILSSSTNFTDSLDLKQVTVNLVEDKVPASSLKLTYSLLKDIVCQMTCHSFNMSNAHKSVVGVLKKLKSYTWDAKAVIALTAFALDYGETWRLSLMQATNKKENALELHVFRLADEEKNPAQSDNSSLINITLSLIKGIITLQKFFANKSYTPRKVPTLFKTHPDVYTYWAVFSLFACANNQMEWDIKSNLVGKINIALNKLTDSLNKIHRQIELWQDLIWRIDAFRIPSGILQLLKALIYPKDVEHFEIIGNNTTKELVKMEELKSKNLLLFISGLDNIDRCVIESLQLIYNSIKNDGDKKDFQILWVPVVEDWSKEAVKKFESLKSSMPWYVLQYLSLIKGYRVLQQEWNYQGKPIVVVADAFGKVLNVNALHSIFLWEIVAFPYDPVTIERVSRNWNWFWHGVFKIHAPIRTWVTSQDKYVFFYGGSATWSKKFHELLECIKRDLEETKTYIEHFNLGASDEKTQKGFWHNISHSLQSYSQNVDSTLLIEIQTLLAMKNQEGWAIVSKGKEVFIIGYNEVMLNVLKGFKDWRVNISVSGFEGAIYKYYLQLLKPEDRACMKFKLDNIHSRVLIPFSCPDPTCGRMMEISSVTYNCCHGMHPSAADDDNDFPFVNGKGPLYI